jgi:RecG-like helicase
VLAERQAIRQARVPVPDGNGQGPGQPAARPGVTPIAAVTHNGKATVEGRIHSIEIRPVEHSCVLACLVTDGTGEITALFYGRTHIPGVETGSQILLRGRVGIQDSGLVMINPAYELIA